MARDLHLRGRTSYVVKRIVSDFFEDETFAEAISETSGEVADAGASTWHQCPIDSTVIG
jgi:hypothetical protein